MPHYTLCAYHYNEQHSGDWQTCRECRDDFEPEMYVWYGTNEYNFSKLENPPDYEPTHCTSCGKIIRLAVDGHVLTPDKGYLCTKCAYVPAGRQPGAHRRRRVR